MVGDDPMLIVGMPALAETETVEVLIQPLEVFVTVSVYVPEAFTVAEVEFAPEVTPGPVQEYETGLDVEEPLREMLGLAQVKV
jgi:hypothetical protein